MVSMDLANQTKPLTGARTKSSDTA